MPNTGRVRYAVAVSTQNDAGELDVRLMVGPFYDHTRAHSKALGIEKRQGMYGDPIEATVVQVLPSIAGFKRIVEEAR